MYGYGEDDRGYGYQGYGGGHGGSGYHAPAPSGGYQGGGYTGESQYRDHQSRHYPPPPGPPPPGIDQYGMPIRGQGRYESSGRHESSGHYGGDSGRYGGSERYESSGHYGGGGYRSAHNPPPPPPSGAQQFGHGAPEGYSFQYSDCSGARRALLIGINYFGQDGELRGCINDVHNVRQFLTESYGYRRENMLILTDDQSDPRGQPTKENILRGMQWLVANAQPNDSLFLHFSGHGGQTEDLDGDEEDGSDEVIYPVDFASAGHIVDDEIHHIVVRPLQPGVRLTAIFDACHSGSAMDLPYIYSTKGVLKEPNLALEAAEGLFSAFSAYSRGDVMGAATSIFDLAKAAVTGGGDAYEKTKETRTSPADVIMWSGSKDSQTSADATINNVATGAMSWAFITSMKKDPQQSYVELLNSIRDLLEEKYSQKPQLSSSHPIDTDLLFIM